MNIRSAPATDDPATPRARFRPPAVQRVRMTGFWGARVATIHDVTAPILRRRCDEAGMMDQIDPDRPVPPLRIPFHDDSHVTTQMFWDSDYGKVIETAAYCLAQERDPKLEAIVDDVVDAFGRLQQDDGYLNSWFQRMEPGMRWTNLRDCHELYCAGHLLEGAVAYFQATGKRKFLDIMCRYMDHIAGVFGTGPEQRPGYCGHEEIEVALVKLYRVTGERKYLDLSRYFIDERGKEPKYFDQEAIARGEDPKTWCQGTSEYNQSHLAVRDQPQVVGHAVRAMYLYSGMADVAAEYDDKRLQLALERLWGDLVAKRIYVTGGMGPSAGNEGFTTEYDLPNRSAYAETCAAVGLVFWAQRMLGLSPEARYGDMLELALYNGALAGISLSGDTFFYENPLESRGDHHRWKWHHCPCCPPNIARLIASIGTYVYAEGDEEVAIHMYAASEANLHVADGVVALTQTTNYPWDGVVKIAIDPDHPRHFRLLLRIPGWSRNTTLDVNGEAVDLSSTTKDGYARITREWRPGDRVTLALDLTVERLYAHPAVRDDAGRFSLRRGPLVYCLEGVDHPGLGLTQIRVPQDAVWEPRFVPELLGGITTIQTDAQVESAQDWERTLYRTLPPVSKPLTITAIPYFAWDHRSPGEMLVWLRQG